MNSKSSSRSRAQGFTLIEALIGLLVMSFGMLAIAGFQANLSSSSDLAKQRTEAMRLAQQKMEELRAYAQLTVDTTHTPAIPSYNGTVVSSTSTTQETHVSNATFLTTWTATSNASDTEKHIRVNVGWTDRGGNAQSVQLVSVISKFDPADIGTLATGPGGVNVRKPKNRNINIPYPAITLSGGATSAFQPPPSGGFYIFDNVTGNILQSCTAPSAGISTVSRSGTTVTVNATGHPFGTGNTVTIAGVSDAAFNGTFAITGATIGVSFTYTLPTPLPAATSATGGTATRVLQLIEGMSAASSGAVCTNIEAYLLSGYVRFDNSANPSRSTVANTTDTTLPLDASTPLQFDFSNVTSTTVPANTSGTNPTATCYAQRQKTLRSNSTGTETTVPESTGESGYSVTARFIAYACIVTPVDHDASTATGKRWWGKVTLLPNSVAANGTVWSIGTTSSTWKVCRFSADYNVNGAISNSEHPLWYRGVTGALDNQNFVVIKGHQNCPTDVAPDPLGSPATYANNSTAAHQATGELSFQCATSTCTGANKTVLEPSLTSTDLKME